MFGCMLQQKAASASISGENVRQPSESYITTNPCPNNNSDEDLIFPHSISVVRSVSWTDSDFMSATSGPSNANFGTENNNSDGFDNGEAFFGIQFSKAQEFEQKNQRSGDAGKLRSVLTNFWAADMNSREEITTRRDIKDISGNKIVLEDAKSSAVTPKFVPAFQGFDPDPHDGNNEKAKGQTSETDKKLATGENENFDAAANKSSTKAKVKPEKRIRKPRYAFQTRSQVDILDDGYRWRKYGQKAVKNNLYPRWENKMRSPEQGVTRYAFKTKSECENFEDGYKWRKYGKKMLKNNPTPRSYYRCSNKECGVKKRVERDARDLGIVITTYEGIHNHESHSMVFCLGKKMTMPI